MLTLKWTSICYKEMKRANHPERKNVFYPGHDVLDESAELPLLYEEAAMEKTGLSVGSC